MAPAELLGCLSKGGNADEAFPLAQARHASTVALNCTANTERVDTRVLQVIYAIDGGSTTLFVGQQMDVFLDAAEK